MARRTSRAVTIIGLLFAVMAVPVAAQEPAADGAAGVEVEAPGEPGQAPDDLAAEVVPPLLEERADLIRRVTDQLAKLDGMTLQLEGMTGEERLVLLGQIGRLELEILELYDSLTANAIESRKAGLDTSELDAFFAREFVSTTPYLIKLINESQSGVLELAGRRDELPHEELVALEERLAAYSARIEHYYETLLEHAERLERAGLDGSDAHAFMRAELPVRADRISGRIELASEQIRTLRERLSENPNDSAAALELRAAEIKLEWATASLNQEVKLLKTLGIPTAQYRQLLIRATGKLTGDIFDTEVAGGLIDDAADGVRKWVRLHGATAAFRLLLFVLIVVVSRALGSFIGRIVTRGLKTSRRRTSGILQELLAKLASRTIMLLGFLLGLSQLGVEIGPLLAGIGIVGVAVGFALQDTLSNFASGIMMLVYQPFDAGDVIETGGVLGSVDRMSLVSTTLLTVDNRKIIVPNKKIWGDAITNLTAMDNRRIDLTVGVAHSEKVVRIEALLVEIVKDHPQVLEDPAPLVKVDKLDQTSVDFVVRPWTRRENYLDVRWDLMRAIKLRFEEEGVEFARARRHVVLEPEGARDEPATNDRS